MDVDVDARLFGLERLLAVSVTRQGGGPIVVLEFLFVHLLT